MGQTLEGKSKIVTGTPVLSLTAYTAADQLGSALELSGALDDSGDTGAIMSVTVIDKDVESPPLDLLFFSDKPTVVSVDNAELDISDAEMASKFLGSVRIAASDYLSIKNSNYACKKVVGLLIQSTKSPDNPKGNSLWMVVQTQGTPTFTAANDLVIKVGVVQD